MADIGDVHDTVDVVAFIAECLFQDILHNITAQVSDVRKMINGRSAGVHCDFAVLMRNHGLDFFCERIVKFKIIFHLCSPFSFYIILTLKKRFTSYY